MKTTIEIDDRLLERGNLALDAQIAAVCREHGLAEILTEDRDFARFDGVVPTRLVP
jgi:predicted nucleic acid-binding protein